MKASDWISVKDRLPEKGKMVFVCREILDGFWHDFAIMRYLGLTKIPWINVFGETRDDYKVTHWQEIVLPKKKSYERI